MAFIRRITQYSGYCASVYLQMDCTSRRTRLVLFEREARGLSFFRGEIHSAVLSCPFPGHHLVTLRLAESSRDQRTFRCRELHNLPLSTLGQREHRTSLPASGSLGKLPSTMSLSLSVSNRNDGTVGSPPALGAQQKLHKL